MSDRNVTAIVIHCSASPDGVSLARPARKGVKARTAAETIDSWHQDRGFKRAAWRLAVRPHLAHLGYHFVIDVDGTVEAGREIGEVGAHVQGHNSKSIGICLVGAERFTAPQWFALRRLVLELRERFRDVRLAGHRDYSPDRNFDGRLTWNEWIKTCPGFDVATWEAHGLAPLPEDVFEPAKGATR